MPGSLKLGSRIKRVESLVEQLLDKGENHLQLPTSQSLASRKDSYAGAALRTPDSLSLESPQTSEVRSRPIFANHKWLCTSQVLSAALPNRHDLDVLCQPGGMGVPSFHAVFTVPYTVIDRHGLPSASAFLDVPPPDTHPLFITRYMLQLALYLQYPRHDLRSGLETSSLSEPLSNITNRLISTAREKVTTRDDLTGSMEWLECLMLESQYDLHHGNLRKSWMSNRKTIATAQLMGLDRAGSSRDFVFLDPDDCSDPRFMWFRMNLNDRHLCLMLGLPQATYDRTMTEDDAFTSDSPEGQLERLHCVLQSKILERHESKNRLSKTASTQDLDEQLQDIAARMPSTWWLLPNFASITSDPNGLFGEVRRLVLHLNHFHLVLQLHIPYISRLHSTGNNEESKATCMIAAREILSRFLILRTSRNIGFGCRNVDFFAVTAALAMILIYLDEHQTSGKGKRRGHQYLGDRGMMEKAQQNMEALGKANKDSISTQSAELMRKLLRIEAQAAAGNGGCADRVSMSLADGDPTPLEDHGFSLSVPFLGKIRIAPEGVSKEAVAPVFGATSDSTRCASQAKQGPPPSIEVCGSPSRTPMDFPTYDTPVATLSEGIINAGELWNPDFPQSSSTGFLAGIDDWALQGVDTAFFSNILGGGMDFSEDGNH